MVPFHFYHCPLYSLFSAYQSKWYWWSSKLDKVTLLKLVVFIKSLFPTRPYTDPLPTLHLSHSSNPPIPVPLGSLFLFLSLNSVLQSYWLLCYFEDAKHISYFRMFVFVTFLEFSSLTYLYGLLIRLLQVLAQKSPFQWAYFDYYIENYTCHPSLYPFSLLYFFLAHIIWHLTDFNY